MTKLKANIDNINSVANSIRSYSDKVEQNGNKFFDVKSKSLDKTWSTFASKVAINKLKKIESEYSNYVKLLRDYATYLQNPVSGNFEIVENHNKSLADQFK